ALDDLTLGLAGMAPTSTFVTRFSGRLTSGTFGTDATLTSTGAPLSRTPTAGRYDCPDPAPSGRPLAPPPSSGFVTNGPAPVAIVDEQEGCSGSAGGAEYEEYDPYETEGCAAGASGGDNSAADSSSDDQETEDDSADDHTPEDDESSDDGTKPQTKRPKPVK